MPTTKSSLVLLGARLLRAAPDCSREVLRGADRGLGGCRHRTAGEILAGASKPVGGHVFCTHRSRHWGERCPGLGRRLRRRPSKFSREQRPRRCHWASTTSELRHCCSRWSDLVLPNCATRCVEWDRVPSSWKRQSASQSKAAPTPAHTSRCPSRRVRSGPLNTRGSGPVNSSEDRFPI